MSSLFDSADFNVNLFFPLRSSTPAPDGARDLMVRVAPDVHVHLRIHTRAGTAGVLLLFHGNGEVVSDYDDAAADFAAAGVDLAVVDYRGYGSSEGEPTLRDALADAPLVLEALRAALPGRPIGVMGRSLGSACAAELCAQPRDGVVAYVLESGISDLAAMVERRGIEVEEAFSAADLETFDPLPKLRRARAPVLILHGARDTLIVPREAEVAYAELGSDDKSLAMIPDRGHNDLSFEALYWTALGAFLRRVLGP